MKNRTFSFSKLQAFECPRRGRWQYIERRKPDVVSVEQLMGTLVHEVAQRAVQDAEVFNRPRTPEAYAEMLTNRLIEALPENLIIPRTGRSLDDYEALAHACLVNLISEILPRIREEEKLLGAERSINFTISDGGGRPLTVFGRIDRLGEDRKTGAVVVHDWKTAGSALPTQAEVDETPQLAVYLHWVRERYPNRPRYAVLHYLAFGQSIKTTRTDEEIDRALETMRSEAARIESLIDYPSKPNGLCRWCGYLPSCVEGQAHVQPLAA